MFENKLNNEIQQFIFKGFFFTFLPSNNFIWKDTHAKIQPHQPFSLLSQKNQGMKMLELSKSSANASCQNQSRNSERRLNQSHASRKTAMSKQLFLCYALRSVSKVRVFLFFFNGKFFCFCCGIFFCLFRLRKTLSSRVFNFPRVKLTLLFGGNNPRSDFSHNFVFGTKRVLWNSPSFVEGYWLKSR